MAEPLDPAEWPEVPPDQRPRPLFHDGGIVEAAMPIWVNKGWSPLDVRLMPGKNDNQRREAVKAWLEGIRVGAIDVQVKRLRSIEMEARTLGLMSGDIESVDNENDMSGKTLDAVLSFTRQKARE